MRDTSSSTPLLFIEAFDASKKNTAATELADSVELGRFCVVSSQMSLVPADFAPTPQKRLDYEDRAEWLFYGPAQSTHLLAPVFSALAEDWQKAVISQRGVVSRIDEMAPLHAALPLLASQTLTVSWTGNTPFELWEDIAEKIGANGAMRWLLANPLHSAAVRVAREPGLFLWLGDPMPQAADQAERQVATAIRAGAPVEPEDEFFAPASPRLQVVRLLGVDADNEPVPQELCPCLIFGAATQGQLAHQWVVDGRQFEEIGPNIEDAEFFDPFSRRAWPPRTPRHAPLWAARQTAPIGVSQRSIGHKLPSRLALRPYPWLLTIQTEASDEAVERWARRLGDFLSLSLADLSLLDTPIETHSDAQSIFLARNRSAGLPAKKASF